MTYTELLDMVNNRNSENAEVFTTPFFYYNGNKIVLDGKVGDMEVLSYKICEVVTSSKNFYYDVYAELDVKGI